MITRSFLIGIFTILASFSAVFADEEIDPEFTELWAEAAAAIDVILTPSYAGCSIREEPKAVARVVDFFDKPDGCSFSPNLEYRVECNHHDLCFMRMPSPGKSFREHFDACNLKLQTEMRSRAMKTGGARVAKFYRKSVDYFGYGHFLNSQADQARHLFEEGGRVGLVFSARKPTFADQELANFCTSVERELTGKPGASSAYALSKVPSVAKDSCPRARETIRSAD